MKLPFPKRKKKADAEAKTAAPAPKVRSKAAATGNKRPAGSKRQFIYGVGRAALPIMLVAFVVASITVFFFAGQQSAVDGRFLGLLDRLQVLSQAVSKEAVSATDGSEQAFRRLDEAAREFDKNLSTLRNGDPVLPLPALPNTPDLQSALDGLISGWKPVKREVIVIVAARPAIINFTDESVDFQGLKPEVNAKLDDFVGALQAAYAASGQIVAATKMAVTVERISEGMARVIAGGKGAEKAAGQFDKDLAELRTSMEGFFDGGNGIEKVEDPQARASLGALNRAVSGAEARARDAASYTGRLLELQAASSKVIDTDQATLGRVRALRESYIAEANNHTLSAGLGGALGAAAVFVLMLLGLQQNRDARVRADEERIAAAQARTREEKTRTVNQDNQDAILRLLDEIGDLADGDLTISATVTEDITGAIADAINFSIEALRDTVTNINESSVKMANAARGSRDTAVRLTQASETQANQIEGAASSIRSLAESARTVSSDATRGQEVATQQVAHAADGSKAVRATIDGMDSIRETIQETSKRIKRLGESSQEIGDIVGLIDDIADQTNILALNAAIQASMAGEQGRGFAVVADEVQRLAERASQATKQIEGLVKAIQSDTNEAVASMEQSTAGVVQGAELAEDAGQALIRIEMVSEELATLVSGISDSSSGQMTQATTVAQVMDEIQRITTEARAGTQETAGAIGGLAQLATDLRTSVAGFRLPDSDNVTTVVGISPTADVGADTDPGTAQAAQRG
jgi:twitching motility protein PilJ